MMQRRLRYSVTLVLLLIAGCLAYSGQQRRFSQRAVVTHPSTRGGHATLEANDPRALWQAIYAFRQEYGVLVDYEDAPITNPADLTDIVFPHGERNIRMPKAISSSMVGRLSQQSMNHHKDVHTRTKKCPL
jgi:hypothetical protein